MLDPTSNEEEKIVAALSNHYGIAAKALHFLPLDYDSATWVFRVHPAQGQAYFLKLRPRECFSESSLAISHYLREQGVSHILAPLPTIVGKLWANLADFALSLYPFIDGRIGGDLGQGG